jgi:hypothetical protein
MESFVREKAHEPETSPSPGRMRELLRRDFRSSRKLGPAERGRLVGAHVADSFRSSLTCLCAYLVFVVELALGSGA